MIMHISPTRRQEVGCDENLLLMDEDNDLLVLPPWLAES